MMARILVADDAPGDRTIACELLSAVPEWHVSQAGDGLEALAQIRQDPPDLVVTDLHMPRLDGLQLLQSIKEEHPHLPVILMTHHGGEELAVRAIEMGAASYVPKRALDKILQTTVRNVLTLTLEERNFAALMHNVVRREEFNLENDPAYVDHLSSHLRHSLSEIWGCPQGSTVRVGVALAEALANAVFHGNLELGSELRVQDSEAFYQLAKQRSCELPYSARRLVVIAEVSQQHAKYTIRDDGPGFDPRSLVNATVPNWLDVPCGRGVLLMRSFMDTVEFNERGNQVVLVKQRSSQGKPLPDATSPQLVASTS